MRLQKVVTSQTEQEPFQQPKPEFYQYKAISDEQLTFSDSDDSVHVFVLGFGMRVLAGKGRVKLLAQRLEDGAGSWMLHFL